MSLTRVELVHETGLVVTCSMLALTFLNFMKFGFFGFCVGNGPGAIFCESFGPTAILVGTVG